MKQSLLFLLLLPVSLLVAQTPVQTILGTVVDKDTRQPLAGATISILNTSPTLGAVSDADGRFSIKNVPVGRRQLQCNYLGYEPFLTDNLIVNSAKEVVLNLELVESSNKIQELVVSSRQSGSKPINELSVVSTRSFSVDETQRYAASASDPGRMAMGFPGVQPSRDSRSDLVIRGNCGIGLLWRLEGVDIPNPNHFARIGTSGGGITVFSVSMLGQSDFSTGAFPAEYGNAVSGVFDMHLRRGNPEKREYTFRAGLLGLDFSTEGPISRKNGSSYLVNYRYSTLGILNKMGIHLVGPRTDNTFQDLSFNLTFPSKNNKNTFTLWGIGGLSKEVYHALDSSEWRYFDDWRQYDFQTNMGAVGATLTTRLGDEAYLKTSLATMAQHITTTDDTLNNRLIPGNYNNQNFIEGRHVLSMVLNKKFSARLALKTGFQASGLFYNLHWQRLEQTTVNKLLDAQAASLLVQPYANLRIRAGSRTTLNVGAHAMYFKLSKDFSIEPRASANIQIGKNQSVSLATGLHSRILPLGAYLFQQPSATAPSEVAQPNLTLPFLKAWHTVLGYDLYFANGLKVRPELYYQYLYDVPVSAAAGDTWSMLNTISGFPDRKLISTGKGRNYGLDLMLEKAFEKGTFLLLSGSLFRSQYTDNAGKKHSTTFDSGISATLMGGKEWEMNHASVLQFGMKILFNGGQRLTPLLPGATVNRYLPDPALDQSRPFSEQVAPYFRPDIRLAWRKNGKTAWTLALDIQNIINKHNQDPIARSYDPDRNAWVFREQSGLTPVLSFQIDL